MGHRDEPTAPGQRPAQRAEHTVAGGERSPSPLNGPGPAQPGNRSPGRGGVPRRDVGRAARAALWIAAYSALFAAVLMIPTLVNWWRETRRDPGGLPPRGADHPGRPRTTRRHRGWQRWWCSSCRCSASRRTSRNSVMAEGPARGWGSPVAGGRPPRTGRHRFQLRRSAAQARSRQRGDAGLAGPRRIAVVADARDVGLAETHINRYGFQLADPADNRLVVRFPASGRGNT